MPTDAVRESDDAEAWGLGDDGPYRGGRVHVLAERCATCIFRPGNLMGLRRGRVRQMVAQAVAGGSAVTCHATLSTPGRRAICRGFWDGHGGRVAVLRLAARLRVVVFDAPPDKEGVRG